MDSMQTVIMHVAIQVATVAVMALKEADTDVMAGGRWNNHCCKGKFYFNFSFEVLNRISFKM